jgi:antitoxin component of MazEF toxin-antitoxin module
MRTTLVRWGDSLAIRLPKEVAAGLSEGMAMDLTVMKDGIALRREAWDIRDLVAAIDGQPPVLELDDEPRGAEI